MSRPTLRGPNGATPALQWSRSDCARLSRRLRGKRRASPLRACPCRPAPSGRAHSSLQRYTDGIKFKTMRNKISKAARSYMMSRVKGKNTGPEKAVRSYLHRMGFRFRICCPELPGRPDIVLKKHRAAIFVHGCFWHQHGTCGQKRTPKTNLKYWVPKLKENRLRDRRKKRSLISWGWRVLTIWECQIKKQEKLQTVVAKFFKITRK